MMADAIEFREQIQNLARHCIQNILCELEERIAENGSLENLQRRLAWLLSVIACYENVLDHAVVDLIADALSCIARLIETRNEAPTMQFFSRTQGRPKFNIPYDQLNFLVERVHYCQDGGITRSQCAHSRAPVSRPWLICKRNLHKHH